MTKAIQRLEAETGARLFERTTRRVPVKHSGEVRSAEECARKYARG